MGMSGRASVPEEASLERGPRCTDALGRSTPSESEACLQAEGKWKRGPLGRREEGECSGPREGSSGTGCFALPLGRPERLAVRGGGRGGGSEHPPGSSAFVFLPVQRPGLRGAPPLSPSPASSGLSGRRAGGGARAGRPPALWRLPGAPLAAQDRGSVPNSASIATCPAAPPVADRGSAGAGHVGKSRPGQGPWCPSPPPPGLQLGSEHGARPLPPALPRAVSGPEPEVPGGVPRVRSVGPPLAEGSGECGSVQSRLRGGGRYQPLRRPKKFSSGTSQAQVPFPGPSPARLPKGLPPFQYPSRLLSPPASPWRAHRPAPAPNGSSPFVECPFLDPSPSSPSQEQQPRRPAPGFVSAGLYPRPAFWAEPGQAVARGRSVDLLCRSHLGLSHFAVARERRPLLRMNSSRSVISFRIQAMTKDHVGTYSCYGFPPFSPHLWSHPSKALVLEMTDAAISPAFFFSLAQLSLAGLSLLFFGRLGTKTLVRWWSRRGQPRPAEAPA
ncbi:cleavage and polyadenylation specificity factor subunit 6-like [Sarcophilus harrisii]|uniref:cleavage and polyadenylation specificity factor subunit 6-like n=1 Tax=Sarcophilus harrisii TaxID=9305 RepID=UPI001301AB7C|nr:cleavage and polyadenylation specificity factor subunit 6-like [Sarcophilus harrisii]